MKNIINTGFGTSFLILGVITFALTIVGVILCAGGFALIARMARLLIGINRSFHVTFIWWASTKHGLNHSLEELGHVLRIPH